MKLTRRSALTALAGTAAVAATNPLATPLAAADAPAPLKGRIHHSVCKWCYGKISLDDLCKAAKAMGIESIDLLGEKDWPVVKQYGLTCGMCNGPDKIPFGWNRPDHHEKLLAGFGEDIPKVAAAGLPNIITFSGNRNGMDDETGLKNCAEGLKKLMPLAEKHQVTVVMELLNSKVNHKDYMADHSAWGVELCKRVGSERFKLLYDIYHMQIMEGDVIRTIQESHQYFAHYHTGGNPGRNEIDETQELNYPAIMKAIVATGFKGFVAQEFIPKRDALTSLKQAIQICDV